MRISDVIAEGYVTGPTEASRRKWANRLLRRRWPGGLGVASVPRRQRGSWVPLVRTILARRDGLRCEQCNREPTEIEQQDWAADGICPMWLQIDHIVPLDREGNHHIDNMRLLCARCNRGAWQATR